jgi:hypothetical protein
MLCCCCPNKSTHFPKIFRARARPRFETHFLGLHPCTYGNFEIGTGFYFGQPFQPFEHEDEYEHDYQKPSGYFSSLWRKQVTR